MPVTILVPRGAEAAAVRRAKPALRVIALPAGTASTAAVQPSSPSEVAVVLGLCGALGEQRVGDVVVYRSVRDERGLLALDEPLAQTLADVLARGFGRPSAPGSSVFSARVSVGAACTTDHVVTTVGERHGLADRYAADVVDMEGTHLAAALAARALRCAMVRVVSDDASRDLPPLGGAVRADGRIDPARLALAFARAPHGALRFVRGASKALGNLTAVARTISAHGDRLAM